MALVSVIPKAPNASSRGWCSSQRSLTGHLDRSIDGVFEIVRVVGRGLVSIAEVHATATLSRAAVHPQRHRLERTLPADRAGDKRAQGGLVPNRRRGDLLR